MALDVMPVVVAVEFWADGVWMYRVLYLKEPFDFCVPIDPPACELTERICRESLGILSVVFVCEKNYVWGVLRIDRLGAVVIFNQVDRPDYIPMLAYEIFDSDFQFPRYVPDPLRNPIRAKAEP